MSTLSRVAFTEVTKTRRTKPQATASRSPAWPERFDTYTQRTLNVGGSITVQLFELFGVSIFLFVIIKSSETGDQPYNDPSPYGVWPDVEIKRSPNFTISSLKISHNSVFLNGMFFKVAPKFHLYMGNFSKKYVA